MYTNMSLSYVIQRGLLQMEYMKCVMSGGVVCAKTCGTLLGLPVMNCILLSAYVD